MEVNGLCMGCMNPKGGTAICPYCGWREGSEDDSPLYLRPGVILNERYLLGRVVGHGGFAITYLAWDMLLNTRVAVKEYMPYNIATRLPGKSIVSSMKTGKMQDYYEYGLEKFLEEARTLARFDEHPGIVSVRDIFKGNGTAYLIMQYLEGMTLKEYLVQKGNRIPYQKALEIMMPVMDALKEVHSVNFLHRDISPDNIFITKNGQIKLIDFGAARYELGEHTRSVAVYKAGYAPEEQYRSKGKQGEYTDVYGAAATLYRAITGEVPPEALDRMVDDTLTAPGKIGVAIPQIAEAALMKALSVFAADRFQTIKELQEVLLEVGEKFPKTTSDFWDSNNQKHINQEALSIERISENHTTPEINANSASVNLEIKPETNRKMNWKNISFIMVSIFVFAVYLIWTGVNSGDDTPAIIGSFLILFFPIIALVVMIKSSK